MSKEKPKGRPNFHDIEHRYRIHLNRLCPNKFESHYKLTKNETLNHAGLTRNPFNLSEKNRELIHKFLIKCENDGDKGKDRIIMITSGIAQVAEMLNKDLDQATKEDIEQVVSQITNRASWSDYTKSMKKLFLKQFFQWLKNTGDEHPPETKWIKIGSKKNERVKMPEHIINEDEIKQLMKNAFNALQRVLIMLLYETGSRVGELGTTTISSLEFNPERKGEAHIRVNGKTGQRRILLIASVPYLIQYLRERSDHLEGKSFNELKPTEHLSPDAPLLVSLSKKTRNNRLVYSAIAKMLRSVSKKAGLHKKVNPHAFRHARATALAPLLTEAELCEVMGWRIGSSMPRIYIHLSGKNVDNSIRRKVYGLETDEPFNSQEIAPKKCEICGKINEITFEYCEKCFNPLSIQARLKQSNSIEKLKEELEQVKRERDAFLMAIKTLNFKMEQLNQDQARKILEEIDTKTIANYATLR